MICWTGYCSLLVSLQDGRVVYHRSRPLCLFPLTHTHFSLSYLSLPLSPSSHTFPFSLHRCVSFSPPISPFPLSREARWFVTKWPTRLLHVHIPWTTQFCSFLSSVCYATRFLSCGNVMGWLTSTFVNDTVFVLLNPHYYILNTIHSADSP